MSEEIKVPLIYAKMSAVMKAITHIGKDQRNNHQNFNFRGIDDLYNSLHGILSEHGVFNTPEVIDRDSVEITTSNNKKAIRTILRIKYTFYAEDGSSVVVVMDGESIDYGDKSVPQAAAIAHKYALLQTFNIPTEEQKDPDHNSHDLGSAQQNQPALITTERFKEIERGLTACTKDTLIDWWNGLAPNEKTSFEDKKDIRKGELS